MHILAAVLLFIPWPSYAVNDTAKAQVTWDWPYLQSGALNLTCSVYFRTFAYTHWSLNGGPLEDDAVLETLLTGRREGGVLLRAHRLEVPRLQRLPSHGGLYNFSCSAVADGELSGGSAFVTTYFQDSCGSGGDDDCKVRGGVCRNGQCQCVRPRPVRLKSKHTTCRHASRLGWPCTYDEQCTFLVSGAHCGRARICECVAGREPDAQGLRCSVEQNEVAAQLQPRVCQSHADCAPSAPGAICSSEQVCRCRTPKELCPKRAARKGATGNATLPQRQRGLESSSSHPYWKEWSSVVIVALVVFCPPLL